MEWLKTLLACPLCKNALDFDSDVVHCQSCNSNFSQANDAFFQLMPNQLSDNGKDKWTERQREMEQWYRDLIGSPATAAESLASDYAPHASYLASLAGLILDIGGGSGIVRHYVRAGTDYVVVDPSLDWLSIDWTSLAPWFPCLSSIPSFVRGVGEYLPFRLGTFDVVLSFWSLNHATEPEAVFAEAYRVLIPGGRFYVVLEDMIPKWHDVLDPKFPVNEVLAATMEPNESGFSRREARLRLILRRFRGNWPLQNDHVRVHEAHIDQWIRQRFKVRRREWMSQYLTFEFEKLGAQ